MTQAGLEVTILLPQLSSQEPTGAHSNACLEMIPPNRAIGLVITIVGILSKLDLS